MPPRLENFPALGAAGIRVERLPPGEHDLWAADLHHPRWGAARLLCQRRRIHIPRTLVAHDPRLTAEDRAAAASAGSAVSIRMASTRKNALHDRKLLLRFLQLLMGDDGLIAVDHAAFKFWSRAALAEELMHDADLDVDALFLAHAVTDDSAPAADEEEQPVAWFHTHGLHAMGTLDFDILRPSPTLIHAGYDTVRAIAFLLLEKGPALAGQTVTAFTPGGDVLLVPVEEFNRSAPAADRSVRGDPDDRDHNQDRVILCDPPRRRAFGLLAPPPVHSSRALSALDSDRVLGFFSEAATAIMSERARKTLHLLRDFAKEFEEFEPNAVVKLGYPCDGGQDREFLWFQVHRFGEDFVEATLLNEPFHIAGMKEGQQGRHDLSGLSDWTLVTPAGNVTPRDLAPARILRATAGDLRKFMAAQRSGGRN